MPTCAKQWPGISLTLSRSSGIASMPGRTWMAGLPWRKAPRFWLPCRATTSFSSGVIMRMKIGWNLPNVGTGQAAHSPRSMAKCFNLDRWSRLGFHAFLGTEDYFIAPREPLPYPDEEWLTVLLDKHGQAARTLWLMHEPPKGTILSQSSGPLAGNSEWTQAIERFAPRLVVFGPDHDIPIRISNWHWNQSFTPHDSEWNCFCRCLSGRQSSNCVRSPIHPGPSLFMVCPSTRTFLPHPRTNDVQKRRPAPFRKPYLSESARFWVSQWPFASRKGRSSKTFAR